MSVTEQQTLAIEALVRRRCNELGLTQPELIRRCRYQNVSKGLRRLEQLYSGDFKKSAGLIDKLAVAVNVPVDTINHAVEESRKYLREAEEAAWRAAFRPHAIILTERQIPQPIFVAALIGVDVLLRLDFDLRLAPATFLAQSLDGLRQRLKRWRGELPAFGRAVGIIINYSPDRAIRFDLEGNAIELFDRAYRLGIAQFAIGGRVVSPGELFSATETTR
jgi:transcriptional regulator with XRE-family HTH domain